LPYSLGAASLRELTGVRPDLVGVVRRAIEITTQDFSVHDGLRTIDDQRRYVTTGVSKTMNSMHMKQADGYGHAVDLVPYINGKLRWEWPAIYPIAAAVNIAAQELRVRIRWGGTWSEIATISPSVKAMENAVQSYVAARQRLGKSAFIDGPHFELIR
jgi:peptidoglycan L-alanyl-D-glutamate endopeptidase CwlK